MQALSHGLVLGAITIAFWLVAEPVHAQSCAKPDALEGFPAYGSAGVPLNAILSAHYFASAEYDAEPVVLEEIGGERREALGSFNPSEGLLSLDPAGFLKLGMQYVVEWPALRGIGSASRGKSLKVNFSVGNQSDNAPPDFPGIESVHYRLERDQDGCAETVQDRFVFELKLGQPSDETSNQDLTLVVFQTKPNSSESPVPVLTRSFPSNGRVEVSQRIEDGLGNVCFAALVRDLTGKVSASGDRVVCTKTVKPPFFQGCAIAFGRAPRAEVLGFALLLGGLWARRRARSV